jgi:valyl-tRNA synthetase
LKFYPTSVMETGHDIIFFWVARMLMMGLHFMREVPFRIVYLHAMVRDEKGEKMSKVKGNVIDPLHVVRGAPAQELPPGIRNKFPRGMPAFGADALRFTLAALTQQGRDIKLSLERVSGYKAFVNKLWNAARFALMNLGDFSADGRPIRDRRLSLADRWILSRLDRAIAETQLALEEFRFSDAASGLYQYLWYELCDWYIELAKIALNGDDSEARDSARATLVFALDHVLRLLHPFMPFVTEEIWQKLPIDRERDSVMVAQYPTAERELRDETAEREMAPIIAAIQGLRTIRGESNLPPQLKLTAEIHSGDPALRDTLSRSLPYLLPLAGLKEARVVAPGPKPPQAAAHVEPRMEIYVPLAGIIDLDEERRRLEKEIGKAEQELAALKQKLENANFVTRAPQEVVDQHRARIHELTARKAKMQENLIRIAPEATMSESNTPGGGKPPEDTEPEPGLESGNVKVSSGGGEGSVNLGEELKDELRDVKMPPEADPHVRAALDKLREGAQDLPPKDRYDLGVAFMGMGLVDDAVREFTAAQAGADDAEATPKRKRASRKRAEPLPRAAAGERTSGQRSTRGKGAGAKRGGAGKRAAAGKAADRGKRSAGGRAGGAGSAAAKRTAAAQRTAADKRSASGKRAAPGKRLSASRPKKRGR